MNLQERVDNYNQTLGVKYPASQLHLQGNFIVGVWMIGNCYRNKTAYYGAYPHSYLQRVNALFPDRKTTLHLFSGSLDSEDVDGAVRFDKRPEMNPDVVGDAEQLSRYFPEEKFDVVFTDPPYSDEDATKYGTPMVNRNRVVKECLKVLKDNGFIVWLDQAYPMYRKDELKLVGTIGLIRSTNHRVRTVFIYQKTFGGKDIQ
ncbi:MAG: class I SAM-dependent methyltransferase [Candidatus Bathyarchaeota archaeon]|nr:class I SAM-dependent methyltransferase [Candidatus Bathyarchaeum sp.]